MSEQIVIQQYDPQWPLIFSKEKEQLEILFDKDIIQIEHFGSTSVPQMVAKPIIDIMLLVMALKPAEYYSNLLKSLDYFYETWPGQPPDHLFFRKGKPIVTHHLHIVIWGSYEHLRHLRFRDYLRSHPETCQAYIQLKHNLVKQFEFDRASYTRAKTAFVRAIEQKVLPPGIPG